VLKTVTIQCGRLYHVSDGKTGGIFFYINKCDRSHALWFVTNNIPTPRQYRQKAAGIIRND
jgi:hypothetical protein